MHSSTATSPEANLGSAALLAHGAQAGAQDQAQNAIRPRPQRAARPQEIDARDEGLFLDANERPDGPMPTPEQVERSMARALTFRDCCPIAAERARQLVEGRKMARSESHGNRDEQGAERHGHGQRQGHPSAQNPQHAQAPRHDGFEGGQKKRRNRNRGQAKSRQFGAPAQH